MYLIGVKITEVTSTFYFFPGFVYVKYKNALKITSYHLIIYASFFYIQVENLNGVIPL